MQVTSADELDYPTDDKDKNGRPQLSHFVIDNEEQDAIMTAVTSLNDRKQDDETTVVVGSQLAQLLHIEAMSFDDLKAKRAAITAGTSDFGYALRVVVKNGAAIKAKEKEREKEKEKEKEKQKEKQKEAPLSKTPSPDANFIQLDDDDDDVYDVKQPRPPRRQAALASEQARLQADCAQKEVVRRIAKSEAAKKGKVKKKEDDATKQDDRLAVMQKQIDALRKDNKDDASRSAATGKSRAGKTRAASPGSPQRKAAGAAAPVPSPARTLGEQINAVVPDKEANKRVDVMMTKYDKTAITALFGHWGFLRFSASYQMQGHSVQYRI